MLTCKQVARALAERRYWDLPWHRRIGLKLHVALCAVCHRYNTQAMRMQEMAAAYERLEAAGELPTAEPVLSESARGRMQAALRRAR